MQRLPPTPPANLTDKQCPQSECHQRWRNIRFWIQKFLRWERWASRAKHFISTWVLARFTHIEIRWIVCWLSSFERHLALFFIVEFSSSRSCCDKKYLHPARCGEDYSNAPAFWLLRFARLGRDPKLPDQISLMCVNTPCTAELSANY